MISLLFKIKPDHVTPLPQILQWLPISLTVNTKLSQRPTRSYVIWSPATQEPHFPLAHSVGVAKATLLFLQCTKQALALDYSLVLFPCKNILSQIFPRVTLSAPESFAQMFPNQRVSPHTSPHKRGTTHFSLF